MLVLVALILGLVAGQGTALESFGDARWGLRLDPAGREWMGMDGLVSKVSLKRAPTSKAVATLELWPDSLTAQTVVPESTGTGYADPPPDTLMRRDRWRFERFVGERMPLSNYDLMLWSDEVLYPWVELRSKDGIPGWTRLDSVAFKATKPPDLRARKPWILRKPFLSLLTPEDTAFPIRKRQILSLDRRLSPDTAGLARTTLDWAILWRDGKGRVRGSMLAGRNANATFHLDLRFDGKGRSIAFDEDFYRKEPRRVELLKDRLSGKVLWVVEMAILYGDGVWTELWLVGPDRFLRQGIAGTSGECEDCDVTATWEVKAGKVIVTPSDTASYRLFGGRR